MTSPIFSTQSPDEEALEASVQGISYPHDFYEVAYTGEPDIATLFPLKLFPAVRTLYRSKKFTIIRLYIGSDETTGEQAKALSIPYRNSVILDYQRAWIGQGEIHEQS